MLPTAAGLRLTSELFRIVLFRRLRMPRACRCGRSADALGDHVNACPTSGVLRTRAVPGQLSASAVRQAGVLPCEMNLDVPVSDARCVEILVSALPVWHGAQVAIAGPGSHWGFWVTFRVGSRKKACETKSRALAPVTPPSRAASLQKMRCGP